MSKNEKVESVKPFKKSQHKTVVVVFGRPGVRGRACGCGHVGAGVSRRRCGCDHVLAGESCLSRRIGIKEAYTAHTLSVCSSLQTWCWNKIMSCVLRRNLSSPLLPQGEEEPPAAVKKMAPSSHEAIGPEVPDECFFLFRRHVGRWSRSS